MTWATLPARLQSRITRRTDSCGWEFVYHNPPNDDDEMIQVLDCDGWQMTVPRDELPSGIDIKTLPVTSV
jgi:hypothetical protein